MHRLLVSTALVVIVSGTACSNSTEPVTIQTQSPSVAPSSELDVGVNVIGDPSTVTTRYRVMVNLTLMDYAKLNEVVRIPVEPGTKAVSLVSESSAMAWCTPRETEQTITVVRGGAAALGFSLDCPPLQGTAFLKLTVNWLGKGSPAIPFTFARTNGTPYVLRVDVDPGRATEIQLPAGIYSVTASRPKLCETSYVGRLFFLIPTPFLTRYSAIVMHPGQTVEVNSALSC